jgi:hypothetical protein
MSSVATPFISTCVVIRFAVRASSALPLFIHKTAGSQFIVLSIWWCVDASVTDQSVMVFFQDVGAAQDESHWDEKIEIKDSSASSGR